MIKIIYCMRRKADLTAEAFQQHWRDVHAPIVLRHQHTLHLARYVQTAAIRHPYDARVERRGVMVPPYDGIAELVWATQEDFRQAFESEQARIAQRELGLDEALFIDIAASARWICDERRLIES